MRIIPKIQTIVACLCVRVCVRVCIYIYAYPSGNHLKNHGNHGNGKIPMGSFKNRSVESGRRLDVSSGSNSFTKDSSMGGW